MKKNRNTSVRTILFTLTCVFAISCTTIREYTARKSVEKKIRRSDVLSSYFTGLAVYDLGTKKELIAINGNKYFTPASNVKILTLAAYLHLNVDSIPTFFQSAKESVLIATGDPTLLHPDFPAQPAFEDMKRRTEDTIRIFIPEDPSPFGPGWAWDDYSYYFQPERSGLPLYGNTLKATLDTGLSVEPSFFKSFIDLKGNFNSRNRDYNFFNLSETSPRREIIEIPFRTSRELTKTLLQDTLFKFVEFTADEPANINDTIFNQPTLPVLSLMMQRSDNFLAEQLLINAQIISGFGSLESYISFLNRTLFSNLESPLIWVDGSGLSRYNMVTPNSMVSVLTFIWGKLGRENIPFIFPTGGVSGTIRNWYAAEEPYVFAKTGTLRHNHNLSGFLETKSGRILVFSFMNNHYPFSSSSVVKQEIEFILEALRDKY